MNQVMISGMLVSGPETKVFASGSSMTAVLVRVEGFAKKDEPAKYDDVRVEAWGKAGEQLAALAEEQRVIVSGGVRTSTWTTPGGEPRSRMFIGAQYVEKLEAQPIDARAAKPPSIHAPAPAPAPVPTSEDIPF